MAAAVGINDIGDVVGISLNLLSTKLRGIIWRNGQPRDIGTVGDWDRVNPIDINSKGHVVGQLGSTTSDSLAAFVYSHGLMYELQDLLVDGTGWVLEYATGVNSHGQICGNGTLNGLRRGFVLTPE